MANLHARIPNAPGLSIPRGAVITDSDVEMGSTGRFTASDATRSATSTLQAKRIIKMSFNQNNNNSFLEDSLPDKDVSNFSILML
ncbi:hypothetical protein D9757_015013 [Collybiopsis confluens]|uniref:Uncharacterized protein n=1 Tax=Collybiopsis confluens TaxID=2823264 RepID=A0A8H5FJL1_9AGAR|nr:hypothetical protein D9757_015013 [Collybiopsis confluens]